MLNEAGMLSLLSDSTLDQGGCEWLYEGGWVTVMVGTILKNDLSSYLAECQPVYFHGTNYQVGALTDHISPGRT